MKLSIDKYNWQLKSNWSFFTIKLNPSLQSLVMQFDLNFRQSIVCLNYVFAKKQIVLFSYGDMIYNEAPHCKGKV